MNLEGDHWPRKRRIPSRAVLTRLPSTSESSCKYIKAQRKLQTFLNARKGGPTWCARLEGSSKAPPLGQCPKPASLHKCPWSYPGGQMCHPYTIPRSHAARTNFQNFRGAPMISHESPGRGREASLSVLPAFTCTPCGRTGAGALLTLCSSSSAGYAHPSRVSRGTSSSPTCPRGASRY